MSNRTNKRRIYQLLHRRFHGKTLWRSAAEQAWLDVAPVGREFGSPDYERLQILDLYASGQMSAENAMRQLKTPSLEALHQQLSVAGLAVPQHGAAPRLKGMFARKVFKPVSIEDMNKAMVAAATSQGITRKK